MASNLFKLIKNTKAPPSHAKEETADVYSIIRCSSESARALLPYGLAEKLKVLPLAVIEMQTRKLLTAAASECGADLKKSLEFSCGIEVKLIPLEESLLSKAIYLAYNGSDHSLIGNIRQLNKISVNQSPLTPVRGISEVKCEVNDFLKSLLSYAIVRKASDIHFTPSREGLFIRMRIDGELRSHEKPVCNADIYKRIVSRVKTLSNLDLTKTETTHDGSFNYGLEDSIISVRVSVMPTIHGEKMVLRIHGARKLMELENLGLDLKTRNFIDRNIVMSKGMVICSGSTGSGKSTTLYAILESLHKLNKSILTVEDPVEIRLPWASQTSINSSKGIDYAASLKTAMRQDPDCIMIGELRDSVSAKIAFEAALTGHLVLTTIHAGSVIETLQRLHEMEIDKLTISQTCTLLINQRLIPRLCDACKVFDLEGSKDCSESVYKAVGCNICEYSGFQSRVIACESLEPDEHIREAVLSDNYIKEIRSCFNQQNYGSLNSVVDNLWRSGKINRPDYIL